MSSAAVARICVAILTAASLFAAVGDAAAHGTLSWIPPAGLAILIALHNALVERERQTILSARKADALRIERSLGAEQAAVTKLNESEARYKALVDAQGDAICRRDINGRLTFANEVFLSLFSFTHGEAVGTEAAPLQCAALNNASARVRYDQRVWTAHGWRWIAWEVSPVCDEHGQLLELQSVGRDITERKMLEDALTDARDKAESASRAKSWFLATMSHEIRTPMSGVLGMARLLEETELRPEQRTYVQAIRYSGEVLLNLIGDVLDFSKIESGALSLEENDVCVRSAVESIVELLAPRAHAKGIELVSVVAPEVPKILRADELRLRQVLTNLLGNAIKFTETGGVQVSARRRKTRGGDWLAFIVRDTGIGIPMDKRANMFREFAPADAAHSRKYGGTGLGLAISQKLVERMGGRIGFTSSGSGSSFWFVVPCTIAGEATEEVASEHLEFDCVIETRNDVLRANVEAQLSQIRPSIITVPVASRPRIVIVDAGTDAVARPDLSPDPDYPSIVLITPAMRTRLAGFTARGFAGYLIKPVRQRTLAAQLHRCAGTVAGLSIPATVVPKLDGPPAFKRRLRVLIAEDDPVSMLLARELLRRRGHEVVAVASGEEAVAAAERSRFDLVFLDLRMPGMDGEQAALAIRAAERRHALPRTSIVALTAEMLETSRRACQDAGMDDFLAKPIDPAELDRMLHSLMAQRNERAQSVAA